MSRPGAPDRRRPAVRTRPGSAARAARLERSLLYNAQAGNGRRTVELLAELKREAPARAERLVGIPQLLATKGDFTSAIKALLLLDGPSRDPDAWTRIGRQAMLSGDEASASKCFAKAIALDEGNVEALVELAKLCLAKYERSGSPAKRRKAQSLLLRARSADPANAEVSLLLQKLQEGGKPPEEAPATVSTHGYGPGNSVEATVAGTGRSLLRLSLDVKKDKGIHVNKVFIHLAPVDGRRADPEWALSTPELVSRSSTLRRYVLKKTMPTGDYSLSVTLVCRTAIFKMRLPEKTVSLGRIRLEAGKPLMASYTVEAPQDVRLGGE